MIVLQKFLLILSWANEVGAWWCKFPTQRAYIANETKSCVILQQVTGRNCVTLVAAVLWCHPFNRQCFLDVRQCNVVLRIINVRNTCKRLCYSQKYLRDSSVQWRKVGRIWMIRLLFHCFLCVRIEIDQFRVWIVEKKNHSLSVICK